MTLLINYQDFCYCYAAWLYYYFFKKKELLGLVESKEGIAEQEWTSWEVSRFPTNSKIINHRQQGAGLQRSKEFGKQPSHF